ncbi:chemotaxis protein CheW, partial [Enterocloster citroniae]
MTDEPVREVLCIPGNGRKYAVEFSYVEEICKDVVLSAMPCLPGYYAGVCNHKGTIVPVVRLEGCIENC